MADLSSDLIAITTGFTGTNLVLFGATDGPGDIIIVVRGPKQDIVVRRKSHVAGMWVNTRRLTFAGVPSYYALFSNRPLDEIVSPVTQKLEHLGLDNLRLDTVQPRSPEEIASFRSALFDAQRRRGLYAAADGKVRFLDQRLFRADIPFPADVSIGTYFVDVYLVRDHIVVAGLQRPFQVQQVGVDAAVNEFAARQALLYGIIAVLGAGLAGWLATLPFRHA
jgi:uncharacterized protein (TIGR02186 family)